MKLLLLLFSVSAVNGMVKLFRMGDTGVMLAWVLIFFMLFSVIILRIKLRTQLAQGRDETYSECPKCGIRYSGRVTICSNCGATCRVYEDVNK